MPINNQQTGNLLPQSMLHQHYLIIKQVGRSEMGAVYQAFDTRMVWQQVAIKEMSQSALSKDQVGEVLKRFHQDAIILSSLSHPHLPRIHEVFSERGCSYLVMDYIEGKTLQELLEERRGQPLPVKQVLHYALQLCDVLAYLHQQIPPIIFRDVKPNNIILTQTDQVFLINFNIARFFKEGLKHDTSFLGTRGYASPEQYGLFQTNPRSDIYSLGATLHFCLTGRNPYHTADPFVFSPIEQSNPQVPPSLAQLVRRMVARDEQLRPLNMQEVQQALIAIAQSTEQKSPFENAPMPSVSHLPIISQVQPAGPDLSMSELAEGSAPANVLVPRFPYLSTVPLPVAPAMPQPTMDDQGISEAVDRYAQWLSVNNAVPVSQYKVQAYQDAALKIKKVDQREIRTFAPFQEHTSAVKVITPGQAIFLAILVIGWAISLFYFHTAILSITLGIITLLYVCGFLLSSILITLTFRKNIVGEKIDQRIIHALDRRGVEWPSYTILCPLYKEAVIVPQFVEAIRALDYPVDKLQVLFLTEEDDKETQAALYRMHLPPHFTVLTVPKGTPQTKPRACNFGLLQAKGQFIVIFDAEDKPEPSQLKKAVLTFAHQGPDVVCVQAKLNFYNAKQNLLTRWFTAEYSTWFDIILPGLQRSGLALPLGGTSNHFRTEALRALGGWDAFNVTEDCDLGLRISRYGLKTAVVDSTTYEEATSRLKGWLFQRSRWIKGYLQTYLVHMRHPLQALLKGRFRTFFSLQLVVGAWTLVLLINPLMWALTLIYVIFRPIELYKVLFPGPILYMGALSLIFGNFFYIYVQLIGCLRRKEYGLIKWVLLIPLYWVIMSISACIALYQLIVKPHYWEKTQHGNHLAMSARGNIPVSVASAEPGERAVAASMPTAYLFTRAMSGVLKHTTASRELGSPTQRLVALRGALVTRLEQYTVRLPIRVPHIRDLWLLAIVIIACITSIASCWYYFQQHEILLYQDALSHMRISRSVFDNVTPGIAQLGTVWLPLPHILMWPFIWSDYLWHSGLAGSFVSMPCYVIAAIYLFLSARRLTHSNGASFVGTLVFIFNPNVLYLQSTPLSETLCIATFSTACYYFIVWIQEDSNKALILAACSTFLATLARYDGWALFLALCCFIPIIGLLKRQRFLRIQGNLITFAILSGLGIVLWFVWNKMIFGDPLSFQHSTYSSEAQQMAQLRNHTLFTYHDLWQSIRYYAIDSEQTIGLYLSLVVVFALLFFLFEKRFSPSVFGGLVFVVPFVFYVMALYNGNAIIWIPGANPPDSSVYLYNVRYGAQVVAPAAIFVALLTGKILTLRLPYFRMVSCLLLIAVILLQCMVVQFRGVVSLADGQFNYMCHSRHTANDYLAEHYNGGKILEDVFSVGFDPTDTGLINFEEVIYEGSYQIWQAALQDPARYVDWILVKPGNSDDLVAQNIKLQSPAFLSQFTLVFQQTDGVLLYHRTAGWPLSDRPAPTPLNIEHPPCTTVAQ